MTISSNPNGSGSIKRYIVADMLINIQRKKKNLLAAISVAESPIERKNMAIA
jgi:hypothetical protein